MTVRLLVPVVMLCLLVWLGIALIPDSTAESLSAASPTVTDAVVVIRSDVGPSQKLLAFERIRKDGSAAAISELVKLTGSSDALVSAVACTTLARMKSDTAKGKLKSIIEDRDEKTAVRTSAMNALARVGTSVDRAWVESKTKDDSDLKANLTVLKAKSFWK